MASIKGCDNSHFQVIMTEALAKKALADGYVFDFHKVTESTGFVDAEWAPSKAGATAAGLMIGGYHLGRNAGGAAEYAFYEQHCFSGPAVLDVEAGPAMSDANSDAWVDAALADKRQVIVYGIYDQIKRHRKKALLWAAGSVKGDAEFTQDGSAGVYGDLDHFHGTLDELTAIFGGDMADTYGDMLAKAGLGLGDAAGNENYATGWRFARVGIQVSNPLWIAHKGSSDFLKGYDDGLAFNPAGGSISLGKDIPALINPS